MFSEPSVLRVTAAVAAATAAVGAAVMRRWDVEAGKRVADLTRARASDEWRHEEKVAELETDLDESRELRTKLEHKLRAKRTELANLRNEHAALLRRYATAETERASALEGRRLLEIEATGPEDARALPAADADAGDGDGDRATAASRTSTVPPQGVPVQGAPWASWETASKAAAAKAAARDATGGAGTGTSAEKGAEGDAKAEKSVTSVFSPTGSSLFLRANSALDRIITQRGAEEAGADEEGAAESVATGAEEETASEGFEPEGSDSGDSSAEEPSTEHSSTEAGGEPAGDPVAEPSDEPSEELIGESVDELGGEPVETSTEPAPSTEPADETAKGEGAKGSGSPKGPSPKGDPDGPTDGGTRQGRSAEAEEEPVPVLTAEEGDAVGRSAAPQGHERAAGGPVPVAAAPADSTGVGELTRVAPSGRVEHGQQAGPVVQAALPALPPAGHFTVPTAVAVVPAAPQRKTAVEGGFDFFGTQKEADALDAVQNEDLADVVGQEALALHKAESEARFKRADEAARGIGQVIDLTAHDETEQIDLQGLRTAAS
ncbi:hypothetical protein [Streptomyces deccanensis]|uniref:hypothetical protein n=1 Tax=Streptomyces deccanensis TaxID=424188 RepID=UPI001EFB98FC|nr:hypothetical protein [Streptomyces deccanensis]ULR52566.1 hypothetical protein L3078_26670 [Streptomyces deccanensis]